MMPPGSQKNTVNDLVRDPQGRIVFAFNGDSVIAGGSKTRNSLARIQADGTLDPDWTGPLTALNTTITCLATDDQGRIYVGGSFSNFGGVSGANNLLRLDATTGAVDPSFKPGVALPVNLIHPHSDGTMFVSTLFGLQRFNAADGKPTAGFSYGGGFNAVQSFVPIPGTSDFFLGNALNGLLRMTNAGATSPGPAADFEVSELMALPSGKIIAAGSFQTFKGSPAGRIAHISADGSFASGLDFGSGFANPSPASPAYVKCLAYEPAAKRILVGGNFLTFNGATANHFAIFDDTTALTGPETPADPYATYLADSGVPAELRAANADADGDGIPNLVEYSLDLNPNGTGGAFTGYAPVAARTATHLELTYRRVRNDVTYVVETSPALTGGTWTSVGVNQGTPAGDGTTTASIPAGNGSAFLRLNVTR